MANYLDENGLRTLVSKIKDNFVPYTGATKDVNLGNRSFTLNSMLTVGTTGTESATYVETIPGNITLKTPTNTIGIGVYAVGVNGTRIYWPKISGDPNGEYFALRSDITSHAGIDKVGTVTKVNGTSPDSNGNVTITIPSAVTETTVSGWGFTKNKGTVIELKVNGLSKAPDTNGMVDVGNVCTYTNTQVDTKIDAASQKRMEVTWEELQLLRTQGNLIPGMSYRITDYTATINPSLTVVQSAGHQFDIVVIADGPNTLNENATAVLHSGDTYFKDCDLNSWRLKYCLDNDRSRFYWAYEKGKGVIYWMEDEFHNQVPYDFKNIMFKRYKVNTVGKNTPVSFDSFFNGTGNLSLTDCISPVKTSAIGDVASDTSIWCYTFCTFENNDPTIPLDASLNLFPDGIVVETPRLPSFLHAFDNVIEPLIVCSPSIETTKKNYQQLNNIVFMKYDKDTSVDTKDDFRVYGNRFSSSSQNITIGRKCYYNTFNGNNVGLMVGYGCSENTFTTCGNTAIAYNCSGNIFNSRFGYNLVFNNCKNNSFGMKCQYLELGENSSFNTFEDDISYVRLVADATGTEPLQYVTVSKGVKGTGSGANMLHLSQPRGLTHTVTYRRVQSETIDV